MFSERQGNHVIDHAGTTAGRIVHPRQQRRGGRRAIHADGTPVARRGRAGLTREDIRALVDVIVQMDRKGVTEIYFLPETGAAC